MNKFYRVRVTRFGLPAFVIATAFQTIGEFYGEIFCVFPEPHSGEEFKIIKADRNSFEEAKVALTEEFMMKEALNQAEVSFSRHIQENYSGREILLCPDGIRFELIDVSDLVHLWVGGGGDFLWDIQNKTRCEGLREELEPIFKLPKLTCTETGDGFM